MRRALFLVLVVVTSAALVSASGRRGADDGAVVAGLDTAYQAAVKGNDAAAMDRILADDFVLVIGKGDVYTKADLLKAARGKDAVYEHQESTQQTVRMYGNTAVVTALLWIKGTGKGGAFDFHVWYSDTYVRTAGGWRYAFGQAGCHLP